MAVQDARAGGNADAGTNSEEVLEGGVDFLEKGDLRCGFGRGEVAEAAGDEEHVQRRGIVECVSRFIDLLGLEGKAERARRRVGRCEFHRGIGVVVVDRAADDSEG